MSVEVSVVIVTYNREKLLTIAIDSILRQTFKEYEVIIVDGASTDNTESVVKAYIAKDARIKYINIPRSKSIAQARNIAFQYTVGKYIAVLDSDDLWMDSQKLEKQLKFLEENTGVVLVGGGAIIIDERGQEVDKIYKPVTDTEIKQVFLIKNPFFHSSVMYRLNDVKKIGGYDEKINFGEDLDLWLRLGKIGQLYNFLEIFIKYRVHNDNEAAKHFGGAIFDVLKIIRKNRKKYGVSWLIFIQKIWNKAKEYFKK